MRFCFISWVALSSFVYLLVAGCSAENPIGSKQAKSLPAAEAGNANSVAPLGGPKKTTFAPLEIPKKPATFAPLGSPKKPATFAPLGSPNKSSSAPKFALRNQTPMAAAAGANAPDRAIEVKRLIDAYQGIAIRYADGLVRATTPEEKEALASHVPSARALRPIAVLIAHLVASDPKDAPALDALVFLCKFVGTPEIDAALAGEFGDANKVESGKIDPMALLLEHHADNLKIINALRRLPKGDATDTFLHTLFDKTFNPEVRWSAGAQLIASLRRNDRPQEMMEQIVITMSEDRYLEGVPVGGESNARTWAVNKLREIRTLGVGMVLPEVSGGKTGGRPRPNH